VSWFEPTRIREIYVLAADRRGRAGLMPPLVRGRPVVMRNPSAHGAKCAARPAISSLSVGLVPHRWRTHPCDACARCRTVGLRSLAEYARLESRGDDTMNTSTIAGLLVAGAVLLPLPGRAA